ncbi:MAG TPA: XdhC/CoxI family protein [Acidimicrobiia bacterium]|nr:XdhC/CoxI family protein [Acidimicrobiia bacterium]
MSAELSQIVAAIEDWSSRDIDYGLATVVGVRGSTYRGLGARQLISADGTSVGTVSGGCLDQDLTAVVSEVIASGSPRLIEFDLTADEEAVWGWGIGCNGVTNLLVEPTEGALALVTAYRETPAAIVHELTGEGLGNHYGVTAADQRWAAEVMAAQADGRHRLVEEGGKRFLVEVVAAQPGLVVCGAGHDAVPMVKLASELGFEVTVVDERRQFLSRERFPEATTLVHCSPSDLAARVQLTPATAVVIMSHNYLRDVEYLRSVLSRPVAYLGCLGPGERLERMLKDLEAQGFTYTAEELGHVHGPAGLDIGADGPVEIAWSVLSEILAVRRERSGGLLVNRKGPAALRQVP